jgi:hypothetical protein
LKIKDKKVKQSKLTEDDMSVIARIIGRYSSLSITVKEDGIWRSANSFEMEPNHRIYAT